MRQIEGHRTRWWHPQGAHSCPLSTSLQPAPSRHAQQRWACHLLFFFVVLRRGQRRVGGYRLACPDPATLLCCRPSPCLWTQQRFGCNYKEAAAASTSAWFVVYCFARTPDTRFGREGECRTTATSTRSLPWHYDPDSRSVSSVCSPCSTRRGLLGTCLTIAKEEGPSALWKGLEPGVRVCVAQLVAARRG